MTLGLGHCHLVSEVSLGQAHHHDLQGLRLNNAHLLLTVPGLDAHGQGTDRAGCLLVSARMLLPQGGWRECPGAESCSLGHTGYAVPAEQSHRQAAETQGPAWAAPEHSIVATEPWGRGSQATTTGATLAPRSLVAGVWPGTWTLCPHEASWCGHSRRGGQGLPRPFLEGGPAAPEGVGDTAASCPPTICGVGGVQNQKETQVLADVMRPGSHRPHCPRGHRVRCLRQPQTRKNVWSERRFS